MAKIVVECTDPNDLEALEEAADQMAGRCNVTYFKQAQALQDSGKAESKSEAARQIATETGEPFNGVRSRINRGAKIDQGDQQEETPAITDTSNNLEKLEKTWGGARPGAGRKPVEEVINPEPQPHNHRAQGTGENEWYTPQEYIDEARNVLGDIDLDPATSETANQKIQAKTTYTKQDDGLSMEWFGRVWLNPPYSQPAISDFSKKMVNEWTAGRITSAIVLTHNYTDTRWFQLFASACTAICFTRGRIAFVNQNGEKAAPTQGQAFFYFGSDLPVFTETFKRFGFVVEVK